jgi:branched-chain amino acid transport system substrate-binding protein
MVHGRCGGICFEFAGDTGRGRLAIDHHVKPHDQPVQGTSTPLLKRRLLIQAATGLGLASIGLPSLAQRNTIILGQSAPFSGPASALGEQLKIGAKLYFEGVNERGGINGRKIELQSLDDGYEPDRCAENTRRLIDRGVLALFGYVGTPTGLAALPLAAAARVPWIAPFTGAEALRKPFNRYAFHARASYYDETEVIVRQLDSVGLRKIGVFYQNDSYGKAGLDGVKRAMQPLGLEPVSLGTVERNTVDVDGAVKSILAARPVAIVQIGAYMACAAFIRAARKASFYGNFYNVSFVGTAALAKELGKDARGVVVSQVMPYPYEPMTLLASEYVTAGKTLLGDKFAPNYSGIEGFIAAKTIVEGLRRGSNGASPENLIAGLESLHEFDLGGFHVDFTPKKHTGSTFVELTLLTAEGRVVR